MNTVPISLTVWGRHVILEALGSDRTKTREVFVLDRDREAGEIEARAGKKRVGVKKVGRDALDRKCGTEKNQGVAADVELQVWSSLKDWIADRTDGGASWTIVALDEIQDPQNLGTLIRSAHFFGASALLLTKDRCAPLTGTVAKASAGALFSLPIIRATNLARELESAGDEGFWRVGLAAEAGKPLSKIDLKKGRTVLVLGGEGEGMRELTAKRCDELASLPGGGERDSLNVAISASIALYEITRQRLA
jgi:23S rRNA (guanosine2251-2'-O)-methyltransferase